MARNGSQLGGAGALSREAWIAAALEVLGAEGVDAVRVEVLARKLGITKGSFYHHFGGRDDLRAAMLGEWRERLVVEVIDRLERISDPCERFSQLLRLPYEIARSDLDLDLAVALWARKDRNAARAMKAADRIRTEFISRTLVACGVAPGEAPARAVLVLAFLREAPRLDAADFAVCERLFTSPAAAGRRRA